MYLSVDLTTIFSPNLDPLLIVCVEVGTSIESSVAFRLQFIAEFEYTDI